MVRSYFVLASRRLKAAAVCLAAMPALLVHSQSTAGPEDQISYGQSLVLWLRADSGIVASGGVISQWNDLSGNGNHATQSSTASMRPLALNHETNGRPVVRFDGINDNMGGNLVSGSSITVVAVASPGAASGYKRIINNESNLFLGTQNNQFASFYGDGSSFGTTDSHGPSTALTAGSVYIFSSTNSGSSDQAALDGSLQPARSNSFSPFSDGYRIGRHQDNASQHWDGDIYEILVFSPALSSEQRSAVESALAVKYGIGVSTSATPAVAAQQTGAFSLGATGAAVSFTANSGGAGSLSSQVINANPGGTIAPGSALSPDGTAVTPARYSTSRYWQIEASGLSSFTYTVTLDLSTLPGITNLDKLVLMKRPAGAANPWQPLNTLRTGTSLSASGLTSFSEFTVGTTEGGALPVSLTSVEVE